ncbi:MAG: hypothetical protein KIH62_002600 [Candidatus Kerfeldbacteria bacterium]|nr:hypothetical protein [Candidatus Kerfeldbacteria bacterium]
MTFARLVNSRLFHGAFFITLLATTSTLVSFFFNNQLSIPVAWAWVWTMCAYGIYGLIPIAYIIERKLPLEKRQALTVFRVMFFSLVLPLLAFIVQWFSEGKALLIALACIVPACIYILAYDAITAVYEEKKEHTVKKQSQTSSRKKKMYLLILCCVIVLGALLRGYNAYTSQLDGDEGNYLYDALHIARGFSPDEQFQVRSLSYIYPLSWWLQLTHAHTIVPARIFFVGIFILSALLLAGSVWLMLKSRKAVLIATALYAISPFAAYIGSILKTEPMQEFYHLVVLFFGLLVFLKKKWWAIIPLVIGVVGDILVRPSSTLFLLFLLCVLLYCVVERSRFRALVHPRSLPIVLWALSTALFGGAVYAFHISSYLQRLFPSIHFFIHGDLLQHTKLIIATINDISRIGSRVLLLEYGMMLILVFASMLWLARTRAARYGLWAIYTALLGYIIHGLVQFEQIQHASSLRWAAVVCIGISALSSVIYTLYLSIKNKITSTHSRFLWAVWSYFSILIAFYTVFNRYYVSYVYELLLCFVLLATYVCIQCLNNRILLSTLCIGILTSSLIAFFIFFPATRDNLLIEKYHFRNHSIESITKISGFIAGSTQPHEEIFSGNTIFVANANRILAMNISHPEFDYHDYPTEEKEEKLLNYLQQDSIQYAILDYKMRFFYFEKNKRIKKYLRNFFTPVYIDSANDIQILKKNPL